MRKYNIFKIILPTISCIKNRGKLPKINIFPLYIIKFFFRHRFSFLKVFTITFSLYEHGIKRWNVFFFFILLPLKLKLFFLLLIFLIMKIIFLHACLAPPKCQTGTGLLCISVIQPLSGFCLNASNRCQTFLCILTVTGELTVNLGGKYR